MPTRVLVAEDSLLVREGIKALFEHSAGLELMGLAHDLDTLLAAVDREPPDLVVTDIRMPPTHTDEGIRAAQRLSESHPSVRVLVLSQYLEPTYAMRLLERGSEGRGYLLKERLGDANVLEAAVRTVASGGSVIDPKVIDALMSARAPSPSSPLSRLSPREREVLALVAQAKSNAAIADELVLTPRAVEKHIGAIFVKLGLTEEPSEHRRVRAVLLYLEQASA